MNDNPYAAPSSATDAAPPQRSSTPVGLPDSSVHKLCIRCLRWFNPEDGKMLLPSATGPLSGFKVTVAYLTNDASALRFTCWRCLHRQRRNQVILWGCLLLVLGTALLLAWLQGTL